MRTLIHMPTMTTIELEDNRDMRKAYDNGETLALIYDGTEYHLLTKSYAERVTYFNSDYKCIETHDYEFFLEETL